MGAAVGGSRKRGGIVGINVTPMVDIMLVLLVIMMVSATFIVSQSLKVELPKSKSSDDQVPVVSQVTISKDGKYYYNSKPVTEPELVEKLHQAHTDNSDLSVVISADAQAQHGWIVHAIDLSKREGIAKFAININRE